MLFTCMFIENVREDFVPTALHMPEYEECALLSRFFQVLRVEPGSSGSYKSIDRKTYKIHLLGLPATREEFL